MEETAPNALSQNRRPRRQPIISDTNFADVYAAETSRWLTPLVRSVEFMHLRGQAPIGDAAQFYRENSGAHLARSPEELAALLQDYDNAVRNEQTLTSAPVYQQLSAGLLQATNLIDVGALGRMFAIASRLGQRVSSSRAFVNAGIQGGILPEMFIQSLIHSGEFSNLGDRAIEVASAGVLAGGIGAVGNRFIGAGSARARPDGTPAITLGAYRDEVHAMDEGLQPAIDPSVRPPTLSGLQPVRPRNERRFGDMTPEELDAEIQRLPRNAGESRAAREAEARRSELVYEQQLRIIEESGSTGNPYQPVDRGLNWAWNWVPSPARRIMNTALPPLIHENLLRLSNDMAISLNLQRLNRPSPDSVLLSVEREKGNVYRHQTEIMRLWAEDTGAAIPGNLQQLNDLNIENTARLAARRGDDLESWSMEVARRYVHGEEMNPVQARAAASIEEYFSLKSDQAEMYGLLQTKTSAERRIDAIKRELVSLEFQLRKLGSAQGVGERLRRSQIFSRIETERRRLTSSETIAEGFKVAGDKEPYWTRYWVKSVVQTRRDELVQIIAKHYLDDPYIIRADDSNPDGPVVWVRERLSTRLEDRLGRANEVVDDILSEESVSEDVPFAGAGRGYSMQNRGLNIPNRLVWDFIEQNPMTIIKTYNAKVAPQIHFRRLFGSNITAVTQNMRNEMIDAGTPADVRNRTIRDFVDIYKQVAGRGMENPSSWNQRVAHVLSNLTALNFLGGVGLTSISDTAKVVTNNEITSVVKGIEAMMDSERLSFAITEARTSGAALDLTLGALSARHMEDGLPAGSRIGPLDKVMDTFYRANMLAFTTNGGKILSNIVSSHQIIENSISWANGTATRSQIDWLLGHGIDENFAGEISRAPWQKTDKGLYVANVDAWNNGYEIPLFDGKQVNIVEVSTDGSPPGRTGKNGVYYPARFFRKNNELMFDRAYIEGDLFENAAWANPTMRGVTALPLRAFATPQAYSNFYAIKELLRAEFPASAVGAVKHEPFSDVVTPGSNRGVVRSMEAWDIAVMDEKIMRLQDRLYASVDPIEVAELEVEIGRREYLKGLGVHFEDLPPQYIDRLDRLIISGSRFDLHVEDLEGWSDVASAGRQVFGENEPPPKNAATLRLYKAPGEGQYSLRYSDSDGSGLYIDFDTSHRRWLDTREFFSQGSHGPASVRIANVPGDPDHFTNMQSPLVAEGFRASFLNDLRRERIVVDPVIDSGTRIVTDKAAYENWLNERAFARHIDSRLIASDAAVKFRNAVNSSIMNTIISGGPNDKPIASRGVFYVPIRIAKRFGMEEDPLTPGYARIENGFASLPFQFFNFMFGSVNKTIAPFAQGSAPSPRLGILAMMGLGYMVAKLKTNERQWDNMSIQDKAFRVFDYSGILPIYSQIVSDGLAQSAALGFNPTGGFLKPRYNQPESNRDFVLGITGASSSYVSNVYDAWSDILSGNYSEGASQLIRTLPGYTLPYLKGELSELSRAIGRM